MQNDRASTPQELKNLRYELAERRVIFDAFNQIASHFKNEAKLNRGNYTDKDFRIAVSQVMNYLVHKGEAVIGASIAMKDTAYDYHNKNNNDVSYRIYQAVLFMNERWITFYSGQGSEEISYV